MMNHSGTGKKHEDEMARITIWKGHFCGQILFFSVEVHEKRTN